MNCKVRGNGFLISVAAIIITTVLICVLAASCSGAKLTFKSQFYFICYRMADNSISASSLSGTVSSYGGAGYILNYNGGYYVTVSCYFNENDANSVCSSLKKRDLDCTVLEITTKTFKMSRSAKKNSGLYLGNLNTLYSLSVIAYECANCLDTGEFSQSKAKSVVSSVKSGLEGLLKSNADNCFTQSIYKLIAECEDKESGYLYSKDMRYLQIALTDAIINAELY